MECKRQSRDSKPKVLLQNIENANGLILYSYFVQTHDWHCNLEFISSMKSVKFLDEYNLKVLMDYIQSHDKTMKSRNGWRRNITVNLVDDLRLHERALIEACHDIVNDDAHRGFFVTTLMNCEVVNPQKRFDTILIRFGEDLQF